VVGLLSPRVTRRFGKNSPNFGKSSQNSCQTKKWQHINIKAQFESQRHLHQPFFEPLKYTCNKPCFETAYLGENAKQLPKQKVSQTITIPLGFFIFSKVAMGIWKWPNWQKLAQSGHPAVAIGVMSSGNCRNRANVGRASVGRDIVSPPKHKPHIKCPFIRIILLNGLLTSYIFGKSNFLTIFCQNFCLLEWINMANSSKLELISQHFSFFVTY
jgi:hypothetical protein